MKSRLERLDAVLAKVNPQAVAGLAKDKVWPGGSAPYAWDVVNGQQRITVTGPEGDRVVGLGTTKDAALGMLEKKLGGDNAAQ